MKSHGGYMQSHLPYRKPNENHLNQAQQTFSLSREYASDHDYNDKILFPLAAAGKYDLIIGFWIFYLESSQHSAFENNPEVKDSPQMIMARQALNLSNENVCDAQTRLLYLIEFAEYIKDRPARSHQYQHTLYYIACLLFETDLISSPAEAIRQFGDIPRQYKMAKRDVKPGLTAFTKDRVKKTFFNQEDDRARQQAFLEIFHQLFINLNREEAPYPLEELIKAVETWLVIEIELKSPTQTSESTLYKIMLKKLGYSDESAHSSHIPDEIKKLRLTQLIFFLSKINYVQWEKAASQAGCIPERLDEILSHYFTDYKKKLTAIKEKRVTPLTSQQAASKMTEDAMWKIAKTTLICCIPSFINQAYFATGMNEATSLVARRIAQSAGDYVGSALRPIVTRPVEWASTAAMGNGIMASLSFGLSRYIEDSSNNSEKKVEVMRVNTSNISFKDFIKLCEDGVSRGGAKKSYELYKAILRIFPEFPKNFQDAFDENIAKNYFVPGKDKAKCPFKAKTLHYPEPEAKLQEIIPNAAVQAPPVPSAPLGGLQRFGITASMTESAPPPYMPLTAEEEWDHCNNENTYRPER